MAAKTKKKLYFRNKYSRDIFVTDVESDKQIDEIIVEVLIDLALRYPKFKSHYQRTWYDENDNLMIDFGSNNEFYILKNETEETENK